MMGMDADVKFGGCWKIIEHDMSHIIRKCIKCGQVETSYLTSYHSELFQSEKTRIERNHQRNIHSKDMIQPIDQKTGKFNEEFGRAYGYNPLKTPAPLVNKPDDAMDKKMAGETVNEDSIQFNKL